ncbi:MAG TPA: sulfite exporter TauE/SafE family protein [Gemmatimonadales bacterium]|nr:sulfite exporter TauE/SafE family protein [Gemmatimonadales bacterium]
MRRDRPTPARPPVGDYLLRALIADAPGVTILLLTVLLALGSILAGLLGALTGLGGGIIIVPLLTLGFGVDIRYAVGASLISVIATSSGAAAAYVKEGYTNIRVGMLLEMGTVAGALVGAWLAGVVSTHVIGTVFGLILLWSAVNSLRPHPDHGSDGPAHPWAMKLRLNSTFPTPEGARHYTVQGVPAGLALMVVAGILSGLLGIGSGIIKVLAMDQTMKLPFKVSTTTSNFMIGVTAAASAGVYLHRGYIEPTLAVPVMLGVLAGALLGARLLTLANVRHLRTLFTLVLVVFAVQMLYKSLSGAL